MRWIDYQNEGQRLEVKLEQLITEREALERRSERMDSAAMDIDWLGQQSREKLFYSHPKEITIWLDE